ncbi:MAG: hypothetical protein Ta2A_10870 [Treponemataceae bacterium]|nr:MAG: hypothetical protein Ta2A_10870 [Treponemataceae bacterium]
MKKFFAVFLLCSGLAYTFAQDNRIFVGVNGIGVTAAYERVITDGVSGVVQADVALLYGAILSTVLFTDIRARFYPFYGAFYVDLGLGYGVALSIDLATEGFLLSPGLGWNFDPGAPGGFVFNIGICSDWILKLSDDPETMYFIGSEETGGTPYLYPDIYSPIVAAKLTLGYCF